MTTPSVHTLLLVGALLPALLPALRAADGRATRFLNVQEIIIESCPGAPYSIVSSFDDEQMMIVEFLPRLPSRVVVPPIHPARITPPVPAPAPFIVDVPGEVELVPSVEKAAAAPPILPPPAFASHVPGKSGCVYLPGGPRIPANIVDVTGLDPGTQARDPITNIIFLVP